LAIEDAKRLPVSLGDLLPFRRVVHLPLQPVLRA
jgi:hypothetical protein